MEFFIINKGVMWNTILQILMDKAAMGVDVRVIYDDMGCLTYLPRDYAKCLNACGIQTHAFNPLRPQLVRWPLQEVATFPMNISTRKNVLGIGKIWVV